MNGKQEKMTKSKEKSQDIYNSACKFIFEAYGWENQKQQLIQELAELIQAITKNDLTNLIEEIADVQVLIDQIVTVYPLFRKKIEFVKLYKVKRQLERIKRGE